MSNIKFDYQKKVQAGLTICRPTGEALEQMQYGAFVQLQDIGCIKNLSAGNFQANFGQGLVIGSPFKMGKIRWMSSGMNAREGVRKFTSIGNDYQAFHGIGTTLRFNWAEVSALYSMQPTDIKIGGFHTGNALRTDFFLISQHHSLFFV